MQSNGKMQICDIENFIKITCLDKSRSHKRGSTDHNTWSINKNPSCTPGSDNKPANIPNFVEFVFL